MLEAPALTYFGPGFDIVEWPSFPLPSKFKNIVYFFVGTSLIPISIVIWIFLEHKYTVVIIIILYRINIII